MRKRNLKRLAFTFFIFFIINCFVVTCSFILFLQTLDYTEEQIRAAAPFTAGNIIFISVLFVIVYQIINYYTVDRPVKVIQGGLDKITKGDFSTRIEDVNIGNFSPIADSINTMTEELQSVETLKTDFISNVSHEIKTPIAVIQNYSQLLQAKNVSEADRMEYAKSITGASKKLSELITNILKLNKLENQQLKPKTEPFDLGAQLGDCVLQFENVWTEKDIELDVNIPDDITVNADAELLSLVWNNLLSNAFKFTDNGGRVGIFLYTEKQFACVEVSDNGCGISVETGKHIFDKFYQGDTSHSSQGNGLGLALVKRIIDIVGGEINVVSEKNMGSVFTVKIRRNANG